ncbi:hypothetical protein CEXT_331861 [Caerostris extrusa]|uniref:Uncharacterized protein n=1 Tax=Caerostris extrusa TaxID=172846 RepID=A0AAV4M3F1_CAEEX|nr:hypothetical protein CEXT_331861 [Caerostris extrusa]
MVFHCSKKFKAVSTFEKNNPADLNRSLYYPVSKRLFLSGAMGRVDVSFAFEKEHSYGFYGLEPVFTSIKSVIFWKFRSLYVTVSLSLSLVRCVFTFVITDGTLSLYFCKGVGVDG